MRVLIGRQITEEVLRSCPELSNLVFGIGENHPHAQWLSPETKRNTSWACRKGPTDADGNDWIGAGYPGITTKKIITVYRPIALFIPEDE